MACNERIVHDRVGASPKSALPRGFAPIAIIPCPAATISGGPEALHQLCDALRARAVDAKLVYYPTTSGGHAVPTPYRHYNVAVAPCMVDEPGSLVVLSEVITSLAWKFQHARRAIWWLSVDNYFKWQHINPGPSILDPTAALVHLCQSHYAWAFLTHHQMRSPMMLTDYITEDVFVGEQAPPPSGRLPIVTFNPKKGIETTRLLMARGGDDQVWLPLEGMDRADIAEILRHARIYVDFGGHPGRDRIPREAAMCGAVVITGRRGSAAFVDDVPLPARFRLDEQAPGFATAAAALIADLLRSDAAFDEASAQQRPYRDWIAGNRAAFLAEVDGFIDTMELREPSPLLTTRDLQHDPC